jgi:hypothetical protein
MLAFFTTYDLSLRGRQLLDYLLRGRKTLLVIRWKVGIISVVLSQNRINRRLSVYGISCKLIASWLQVLLCGWQCLYRFNHFTSGSGVEFTWYTIRLALAAYRINCRLSAYRVILFLFKAALPHGAATLRMMCAVVAISIVHHSPSCFRFALSFLLLSLSLFRLTIRKLLAISCSAFS